MNANRVVKWGRGGERKRKRWYNVECISFQIFVSNAVFCRLQEKHVLEVQIEHQKKIIDLQERLKTSHTEVIKSVK